MEDTRRLDGGKSVWIVYGKERRKGLELGKGETVYNEEVRAEEA